jgi:hypothetical protein
MSNWLCFAGLFLSEYARRGFVAHSIPLERKYTMSQSNLSDGAADGLAAVIIVSVVVTWVVFWLSSMPA